MPGIIPSIDFSPLGELGKTYKDAQLKANRERTLAELGQGADIGQVASKLFQVGDVEGGLSLSRLADAQALRKYNMSRDDRDFGFKQQEAQRTQQNQDRNFRFQEQQAQEKPQLKTVKDASGNETIVQITPQGKVNSLDIPGQGGPATNPYASGKQTEGQAKDSLYASRMFQAEQILRDPAVVASATSSAERFKGAFGDKIPFGAGRQFIDANFQKFDQAQRNFINAVLRRESGAVISDAEFENARKQYFPQPGDTKELIQQKKDNRAESIKGIAGAGGPSYRPPFVFDQSGGMAPNAPSPQRAASPSPTAVVNDAPEISQAREAIARGASKEKVIQRLRENNIPFNPADLELQ